MTTMPPRQAKRARARAPKLAFAIALIALALGAAGCGTAHPKPIAAGELAEAQTFPYYLVYWVGPSFEGRPLAAADGLHGYIEKVGDSVYYGDCVQSKGIFGGGSCVLPLQVTTVIYHLHFNGPLGAQRNILVRGVPATVYDEGRSIELYSGRVAIDIFSDTYAHALNAALRLLPLNASGSAAGALPPPVYCPGLSGPLPPELATAMASLPGHACQKAAAQLAYTQEITGRRSLLGDSGSDWLADLAAQAQKGQRADQRGDPQRQRPVDDHRGDHQRAGRAPNSSSIPTRPPSTARNPPGTGTELASMPTR